MWPKSAASPPVSAPLPSLEAGEVGYMICNIKTLQDTKVGDTVTDANKPAAEALPGYEEVKPVVFCGCTPPSPRISASCATRWKS